VRIGSPYQALVNLSLPRRDPADKNTDLVMKGDTVYLTDAEAAAFNRHGNRDGRRVEVLRKLSGPAGNVVPNIPTRALSGPLQGPPVDARPDPAGSSFVTQQAAPMGPPEGNPPVPGSEMSAGQQEPPPVDAVDLPPTRSAGREAVAGVDQDLVNAVRATLPKDKR
jgi:hypothetical protein